VAGLGICDAKNRFGDVLQTKLGDGYAVFNVAEPGWETPDEIRYPPLYPYRPDIVVLSYFVNDIQAAMIAKHPTERIIASTPWWANTLLGQSFLLDYVYWQIIYKQLIYRNQYQASEEGGWKTVLDSYFLPDVWELHKSELMQLIAWARQGNRPVIAIIWPRLDNIASSVKQVALVEDVFKSNGVTVVNALDLVGDEPPAALVVSNTDAHPNENVQRRAADALYQAILHLPQ
jgi:hypothetical protein